MQPRDCELKVLLTNEKLMFHSSPPLRAWTEGIVRLGTGSIEEGGLCAGRALLNKTARRSEQFVSISVSALFVGRRSADRPGLDFASVGQASDSGSGRT